MVIHKEDCDDPAKNPCTVVEENMNLKLNGWYLLEKLGSSENPHRT